MAYAKELQKAIERIATKYNLDLTLPLTRYKLEQPDGNFLMIEVLDEPEIDVILFSLPGCWKKLKIFKAEKKWVPFAMSGENEGGSRIAAVHDSLGQEANFFDGECYLHLFLASKIFANRCISEYLESEKSINVTKDKNVKASSLFYWNDSNAPYPSAAI